MEYIKYKKENAGGRNPKTPAEVGSMGAYGNASMHATLRDPTGGNAPWGANREIAT